MRASIAVLLLAAVLAVGAVAQDGPRLQGLDGGELTQSDIERGSTVWMASPHSSRPRAGQIRQSATKKSGSLELCIQS